MAESWSVEAMKIVIDSETEKFSAGITAAKGMVEQFSSSSTVNLKAVDGALLKVGASVDAVRSKLGVWLQLAETALSFATNLSEKLETAAQLVGWGDEAKEVTGAVTELATSIASGLGAAINGTRSEIADMALAMAGLKAPTDEATAAAQEASTSIGKTLSEAIDRVATAAKNFKIVSYDVKGVTDAVKDLAQAFKGVGGAGDSWALGEWQRELKLLEEQFSDAKRKAQEMDELAGKAGQAINQFSVLNAADKVKGLTDRLSELLVKIGEAKDKITELSKAKVEFDDSEIDKHIATLDRQTIALSDQAATLGMTSAAAREWLAVQRALRDVEDKKQNATEEKLDALRDKAAHNREREEDLEAEKRKLEIAKASEALTEKLIREAEAVQQRTVALDMAAPAAAAYLAEQKALTEAAQKQITLSEEQISLLRAKAAQEQSNKDIEAEARKADEAAKASENLTEKLTREIEALRARATALGMSGPAAAAYLAEQKALAEAAQRHITLTDQQRALIASKSSAEQALKDAESDKKKAEGDEKAVESAILGIEKQIAALQQKARALTDTSVAGNSAAIAERVLSDLHAKNVEMTEADIAAIKAWARAQAEATKSFEDNQKQLQNFKSAAQAVTSELDNAFKSWTQGSAFDVKKMVQSMLSDLAMLTFKKGVTENLSNMMTSGLSSLFGGFREGGGPVAAGVPYVVGERQPELFIPDQPGYVLPQVPQAPATSSSSVTHMPLNLSIDARGATPDAVRLLEARIPGIVMTTFSDLRERGHLQ